jgi:hypothetical protein
MMSINYNFPSATILTMSTMPAEDRELLGLYGISMLVGGLLLFFAEIDVAAY